MTNGEQDKLTKTLKAHYISKEQIEEWVAEQLAARKAQSARRGILLAMAGIVVGLMGLSIPVLFLFVTKSEPGIALLAFAAPFMLVGLVMVLRGASTASGEALDVQKELGGIGGAIASIIRGKNNGA